MSQASCGSDDTLGSSLLLKLPGSSPNSGVVLGSFLGDWGPGSFVLLNSALKALFSGSQINSLFKSDLACAQENILSVLEGPAEPPPPALFEVA